MRPNGLAVVLEVEDALRDAADRLAAAGWAVEEIHDTPSFREATELQVRLWLGEGYASFAEAVAREGDPGAMAVVAAWREQAEAMEPDVLARTLTRRATLTREWMLFLAAHPILLLPVSAELPFDDGADLAGAEAFRKVWEANLVQTGLPLMGLPGLTVSTGLVGRRPVGVQLVGQRYREDLLLLAGEAIEAGGTPPMPIDPVW